MDSPGKKLLRVIDRASFKDVFVFWIIFMLVMGVLFFVLSAFSDTILYRGKVVEPSVENFFLTQYFSFITAVSASQGYGDIFPLGIARVFAVLEAVAGLLLFGLLIAKLVSVKQEVILEEVYGISHEEKLNRVRSTIDQFTLDMNKVMDKVHQGMITKRSIKESWVHFHTLSKALQDLNALIFNPRKDTHYVKTLDFNHLDLLTTAMTNALQKTIQFFDLVEQRKLEMDRAHVAETLGIVYDSVKRFTQHYQHLPEIRQQFVTLDSLLEATKTLLNRYTGYKKYI